MNKPKEHRMCTFYWNKQIRDEHHYIFKCTRPKFIQIGTKLFEAIFELADQNSYRYESTQYLYWNYYLIKLFLPDQGFQNGFINY